MLLNSLISGICAIVLCITAWFAHKKFSEKNTLQRLSDILFPLGESQKDETLNDMNEMTQGRFTREDLLDFYLKIKGLHTIDLHSNSDGGIRRFLMRPTKIRLSYFEQVKFYEIYLNYPQAVGQSIMEH